MVDFPERDLHARIGLVRELELSQCYNNDQSMDDSDHCTPHLMSLTMPSLRSAVVAAAATSPACTRRGLATTSSRRSGRSIPSPAARRP